MGVAVAQGDWLLFLYADTILAPGWEEEACRFMAGQGRAERAAAFRFALDDTVSAARRVERLTAWRCQRMKLPYGDHGLLLPLLLPRLFYDRLGAATGLTCR